MNQLPTRKFKALLSSTLTAGLLAATGYSQTAASSVSTEPTKMEKYVVTGSYLQQSAMVTPNPVIVLDSQQFTFSGATDALDFFRKETPYFSGGGNIGKEVNNGGPAGESYIALRNLQTLVLLDGRRMVSSPASTGTAVDLNTIPSAMIDHIEILKDGASTLYGSDAVGGVVNIITKKNYNGFELRARRGFDHLYDYHTEDYSLVGGFSDGHTTLTIGAEYYRNTALKTTDRGLPSMEPAQLRAAGRIAAPSYMSGSYYGRVGSFMLAGSDLAVGAPGYKAGVNTPPIKASPVLGTVSSAIPAALTANGTYIPITSTPRSQALGNTATILNTTLYGTASIDPTNRKQVLANFSRELAGDKLEFFANFLYSHTENTGTVLAPGPTAPGAVDFDNMIIPANNPWNFFNQDITSFPGFNGSVRNRFVEVGNRSNDYTTNTFRMAGGFRGKISSDFSWELGFNYGHADYKNIQNNAVNGHALNAAMTPLVTGTGANAKYVYDSKGRPLSTLNDPNGDPVPVYNYLALPGFNAQSTLDAIRATLFRVGNSELKGVDFVIHGNVYELPAGNMGVALGADYRGDAVDNSVDTLYASGYLMGGLNSVSQFSGGKTNSKSLFGEVEVPLVSKKQNVPGFYSLGGNISGRFSKLNTGARSNVPKLGGKWQPFNEDLALRATYAKSFVAPSVVALYGPAQGNSPTVSLPDALAGNRPNSVQITSTELANPGLAPSKATSYTAGFVYSPRQIKGLSMSFDWYSIKQDQQGTIDYQSIFNDINAKGSGSPYAATYKTSNGVALTTTTPNQVNVQNVGSIVVQNNPAGDQKTEGLDIQASYDFSLPSDMGRLRLSTASNILFSYKYRSTSADRYLQYARKYTNQFTSVGFTSSNNTFPGYSLTGNLVYSYKNWSAMFNMMYIPAVHDVGDLLGQELDSKATNSYTVNGKEYIIPKYYKADLTVSYDFKKTGGRGVMSVLNGVTITAGANNLFNKSAPFITSATEDNTDKQTYDMVGRFFFIEVGKKF